MPLQRNKWKALGEVFEARAEPVQLILQTNTTPTIDTDSAKRIERVNLRLSKYLHQLGNEPSLGLYHVSEHIKKSVPKSVKMKVQISRHF